MSFYETTAAERARWLPMGEVAPDVAAVLRDLNRALARIAELEAAVLAEREACDKATDTGIPFGPWQRPPAEDTFDTGVAAARQAIRAAIRARPAP